MSRAGTPRRPRDDNPTLLRPAAPAPAAPVGQLMSLAEAARRLAVSVRTLERLINRGDLHVVRLGRGRGVRRVTEAELSRLITAGGNLSS